jgi:RNA polymerase sigma-70 factor (ECF subfamily)
MSDPDPFTAGWSTAQEAVTAFVRGVVRDRATVEEIVQEVAVSAFRSRENWAEGTNFTAWCIGIARNLLRMRWRTLARDRHVLGDPDLMERLAVAHAEIEDAWAEERPALAACLRTMTGRSRELVVWHYYEGRSVDDIAALARLAPSHIRVLLHRIRAALRECIRRRIAGGAPA